MRFLKFTILFILLSINADILSQWVTTGNYTNVGLYGNLNIELKVNEQYNSSAISCVGASDGEMAVIISGGTPPYSVNWAGITNTGIISSDTLRNRPEGTYSIIVLDAAGEHTFNDFHKIILSDPENMYLQNDIIYDFIGSL